MMTRDVGADAAADTDADAGADTDAGADAGADTDTDGDTLTRQQTCEPQSHGVSKQAFFLTLGPVLDTLRRHGHCVFLR